MSFSPTKDRVAPAQILAMLENTLGRHPQRLEATTMELSLFAGPLTRREQTGLEQKPPE